MQPKVHTYFPEWAVYDRNVMPADIDWTKVDVAIFAFLNISAANGVVFADEWADTGKPFPAERSVDKRLSNGLLKEFQEVVEAYDTEFCLSIGGWTYSAGFSDALTEGPARKRVLSTLGAILAKYPFVTSTSWDWEYPSDKGLNYGNGGNKTAVGDGRKLISFLKEFRSMVGPKHQIYVCLSADPNKIDFDVKALADVVDGLHVMTYDFDSGAWGAKVAAHHTNLKKTAYTPFGVDTSIEFFLSKGVPAKKLYIGGATYSRGYKSATGTMGGPVLGGNSTDKSWEEGIVDWKSLPVSGAVERWHEDLLAPSSYDSRTQNLNTYDNTRSIALKAKYCVDKGLGGILFWEAAGDRWKEPSKCLHVVAHDVFEKGASSTAPTPKPNPTPTPSPTPAPTRSGITAWTPGRRYEVGWHCKQNGKLWQCTVAHTAGQSFDTTKFCQVTLLVKQFWALVELLNDGTLELEGKRVSKP